jgi:DNA-binding response OmpR family regulator
MAEADPGVRETVGDLLTTFGYDCQTAADGASGRSRFDEGNWDLVLTDLAMPEMSGRKVVEAIRHRAPTMPIVLITGLSDPAVIHCTREWRVPVILKPFRLDRLKAAPVEALCAQLA